MNTIHIMTCYDAKSSSGLIPVTWVKWLKIVHVNCFTIMCSFPEKVMTTEDVN